MELMLDNKLLERQFNKEQIKREISLPFKIISRMFNSNLPNQSADIKM